MPLHPEIKRMLDTLAAMDAPPLTTLSPRDARANYLQMARLRPPSTALIAGSRDQRIPGPGGDLQLRLYTPAGDAGDGWPLLAFFHGGGFVVGDLDSHDSACRDLCAGARCVVVAVHYRLAPEHKFPAAVDDCEAATRWIADHAAELGGDARRLAVAGDSAGANLATVVARRLRDAGGPPLCAQLLVYPVTDHYSRELPSMRDNADGYLLTRSGMAWFADHYLRDPRDIDDPDAAPLRAASLAGMPPTWIATAEYDPLRDEGEAYAERLHDAGVATELKRYDGAIHGIFVSASVLTLGRQMMDDACAWLRTRFSA